MINYKKNDLICYLHYQLNPRSRLRNYLVSYIDEYKNIMILKQTSVQRCGMWIVGYNKNW